MNMNISTLISVAIHVVVIIALIGRNVPIATDTDKAKAFNAVDNVETDDEEVDEDDPLNEGGGDEATDDDDEMGFDPNAEGQPLDFETLLRLMFEERPEVEDLEDPEIDEDIAAELKKLNEATGENAWEPLIDPPDEAKKGTISDAQTDRLFQYVVINVIDPILAYIADAVAEALAGPAKKMKLSGEVNETPEEAAKRAAAMSAGSEVGKTLAAEMDGKLTAALAKALDASADESARSAAYYLEHELDRVIKERYDHHMKPIGVILGERLENKLAKMGMPSKWRKVVMERFYPDVGTYLVRGIKFKLADPGRLAGNKARENPALTKSMAAPKKAPEDAQKIDPKREQALNQATADRLTPMVAAKLDKVLPGLLEKAINKESVVQMLRPKIDRSAAEDGMSEGEGLEKAMSQLPPMDIIFDPLREEAPHAGTTEDGVDQTTLETDLGMATVRDTMLMRARQRSKVDALRKRPPPPQLRGNNKVVQRNVRRGTPMAITPRPLEKVKRREKKHAAPLPTPIVAIRFSRAIRRTQPITIDGDLSDWKKAYPLTPRNFKMHRKFRGQMYLQWDPDNIYVGCVVMLDHPKVKVDNFKQWWLYDTIEFWVDSKNSKPWMKMGSEHHQYVFTPPDKVGDKLGQVMYAGQYAGLGVPSGIVWHKPEGDTVWATKVEKQKNGNAKYTFEIRLKRGKEFRDFEPYAGNYIGFDYIISSGVAKRLYWGCDKSWEDPNQATYMWSNPMMWGDVELVGTEAILKITDKSYRKSHDHVFPGQPIFIRVNDYDMDLNSEKREIINALVTTEGSLDSEAMTLYETTLSSGVFVGTVKTTHQTYGESFTMNDGVLAVREGSEVKVTYIDVSRESGARNIKVVRKLPVVIPVAMIR